jgi:ribonuclease P protein component
VSRSIARAITQFSETEIKELFRCARTVFKQIGLEIRRAPTKSEFGRILIVIPRLVGSAPQRNLIRRRIKALFYQGKLYEKKQDLIVLVRKGATKLSYQELKQIIESVFEAR